MVVCKAAKEANGKTELSLFICYKVNSINKLKELTLLHKKQTETVTMTVITTYDITMTTNKTMLLNSNILHT